MHDIISKLGCTKRLKEKVVIGIFRRVLCDGIRILAYFLNGIRKNCIHFGGCRKTGILSDTKSLYFEGRNTAMFQSYGHRYFLNSCVSLCQEVNNILVPISDH